MNRTHDVLKYLPSLRRYARALTRDDGEAEDLVHDALVRAYDRRATFQRGRRLGPWLLSILHNAFIDRGRVRRAESARHEAAAAEADSTVAPVQDHVVRLAQIRRAFDALPDDQRAALHLVAIEGLSYQDAADTLGIPIGTLMSRVNRARAALRAFEQGPSAVHHRFRIVGGRHDDNT